MLLTVIVDGSIDSQNDFSCGGMEPDIIAINLMYQNIIANQHPQEVWWGRQFYVGIGEPAIPKDVKVLLGRDVSNVLEKRRLEKKTSSSQCQFYIQVYDPSKPEKPLNYPCLLVQDKYSRLCQRNVSNFIYKSLLRKHINAIGINGLDELVEQSSMETYDLVMNDLPNLLIGMYPSDVVDLACHVASAIHRTKY